MDLTSPRKLKVVAAGSYNVDLTVQCPYLPAENQTIVGGGLQIFGGGCAGNSAVAAARAGCEAILIGGYGLDAFGALGRARLTAEGVNLDHFQEIPRAMTGVAVCILPRDTGRSILVITDSANQRLTAALARSASSAIQSAELVVVDTEVPGAFIREIVQISAEHGVPCILYASVSSVLRDLPSERLLAVVVQGWEAAAALGTTSSSATFAALHRRKVENVVLLENFKSLRCSDGMAEAELKVPCVQVVDRCGAAEAFVVWLGLELVRKRSLVDACRTAAEAMAYSLSRIGGHHSLPKKADLAVGAG